MRVSSDFKELLAALNAARARFLVVGAYAVIHHTEPRFTKDLDLWIEGSERNAARVLAALRAFGAPVAALAVADLCDPDLIYQLGVAPVRVAAMLGMIGAGRPPLMRVRVAVELLLSGHREIDAMISSHARLAQMLARQLGLHAAVADAVGAAYEQWDGRGWPGKLAEDAIPIASRIAQLGEYVEVAHRTGDGEAVTALTRARRKQFDPKLLTLLGRIHVTAGLDAVGAWDAVIAGEPALAVVLSDDQFDSALLAIASFVDLNSRRSSRDYIVIGPPEVAAGALI